MCFVWSPNFLARANYLARVIIGKSSDPSKSQTSVDILNFFENYKCWVRVFLEIRI